MFVEKRDPLGGKSIACLDNSYYLTIQYYAKQEASEELHSFLLRRVLTALSEISIESANSFSGCKFAFAMAPFSTNNRLLALHVESDRRLDCMTRQMQARQLAVAAHWVAGVVFLRIKAANGTLAIDVSAGMPVFCE